MDGHTKSQRQPLQSVLCSARLKDVWVMEKTAVFCSASCFGCQICNFMSSWTEPQTSFFFFFFFFCSALNVVLLHLSAFCSHCKHILTMTAPDNSKLTLIAVDQSGCSGTETSCQCNWDKLLSWQFIL